MSDHAVKVRAPSGWVDLAYIATGPQGPKGDKGDTGAPGQPVGAAGGALSGQYPNPTIADSAVTSRNLLLDSQQIDSTQTVLVNAPPSGSEIGRNLAAGTDWRLSYTPSVNCWWEFTYRIPQISKSVDGWAYVVFGVNLHAGAVPATPTTPAYAPGVEIARGILSLYGPNGSPYGSVEASRRIALSAGVTYRLQPTILYNGTNWQIQAAEGCPPTARAKAWAR